MATHTWTGAGDHTDYGLAGNWDGGVPINAGDVVIDSTDDDITGTMDQSGVNPASWTLTKGFRGTIGTSASPLKLGTVTSLRVDSSSSSSINLWPATATAAFVENTQSIPGSLYITQGTLTLLGVASGRGLRIGAATLTEAYFEGANIAVLIDAGATLTLLYNYGAHIVSSSALVTLHQYGGMYEHIGSATNVTTGNIWGGTFYFDSGGATATTFNVGGGGLLDCRRDGDAKTITTANVHQAGTAYLRNGGTLTVTTINRWGGRVSAAGTVTEKFAGASAGMD